MLPGRAHTTTRPGLEIPRRGTTFTNGVLESPRAPPSELVTERTRSCAVVSSGTPVRVVLGCGVVEPYVDVFPPSALLYLAIDVEIPA